MSDSPCCQLCQDVVEVDAPKLDDVIVIESDDEGTSLVPLVRAPDAPVDAFAKYWGGRTGRFTEIWRAVNSDSTFSSMLSHHFILADDLEHQIHHATTIINDRLAYGYINTFKVGITYKPVERFHDTNYGYSTDGFHAMILLVVSDMPDFIISIERELIRRYRKFDRRGQLINASGHALCSNRAEGGESGTHGISPFFVYVALRLNK